MNSNEGSGVDHPKRANESLLLFHYDCGYNLNIFFHVSLIRHDEISSDHNFTWNVIDMFNGIVSLNIFMRVIESLLILNTFWLRLLLTWSIQVFSDAYQNDKHLLAVSSLWFFPINFVDWFVIRLRRDGVFFLLILWSVEINFWYYWIDELMRSNLARLNNRFDRLFCGKQIMTIALLTDHNSQLF